MPGESGFLGWCQSVPSFPKRACRHSPSSSLSPYLPAVDGEFETVAAVKLRPVVERAAVSAGRCASWRRQHRQSAATVARHRHGNSPEI